MKATASAPIGETLIDSRQAAKKLGCSVRHLDNQRAAGKIPFIRIGNLIRFSLASLDEWIREQANSAESEVVDDA
ncbi:Helix-turn-helix domain protein [Symmachiella macrocystis]|uniref:Helix-turn-helix domain protein n=1 Tax=Symmachiella macrocystis TaxID=2527985 RepID=A0A5C6BS35_9PLAN|nr:helix-turn-helix domain-containing protein [Symmachiella macrocystis]TWU14532.1 Helix-turn-helix domain protein [Symmachiella macrocystis]